MALEYVTLSHVIISLVGITPGLLLIVGLRS